MIREVEYRKLQGNIIIRRKRLQRDDQPAMESISSELKAHRESRNISLAQIATDTHISLHYLESLEEGRFNELPGGMYNRAFLRAYCERLDLDQSEMLQRYESEVLPFSNKPIKTKSPIASSIKIPPLIIWSLLLLISATSIFLNRKWIFPVFSPYFSSSSGMQDHDAPIKRPAPTPMALPSSSKSTIETASIPPSNPVAAPSSIAKSTSSAFLLEIIGKEKCWVSINSDGASVFSRTMQSGEVQSFNAEQRLFLILGNAGGVLIKINGKTAKPLGKSGEVIRVLINETTLPDLIDRATG
jgi:transcriptional regulator with XRE-family HTH domain